MTMTMTLNVSMIILIFMPLGWGIIFTILMIETVLFYLLFKRKIPFLTNLGFLTISNLISGLGGFGLSLLHNGGWYGVFWFPWVGKNELNLSNAQSFYFFVLYFVVVYLITMLIEIPINILLYRRKAVDVKSILRVTFLSNVVTNIGCALLIYLWSFH